MRRDQVGQRVAVALEERRALGLAVAPERRTAIGSVMAPLTALGEDGTGDFGPWDSHEKLRENHGRAAQAVQRADGLEPGLGVGTFHEELLKERNGRGLGPMQEKPLYGVALPAVRAVEGRDQSGGVERWTLRRHGTQTTSSCDGRREHLQCSLGNICNDQLWHGLGCKGEHFAYFERRGQCHERQVGYLRNACGR